METAYDPRDMFHSTDMGQQLEEAAETAEYKVLRWSAQASHCLLQGVWPEYAAFAWIFPSYHIGTPKYRCILVCASNESQ